MQVIRIATCLALYLLASCGEIKPGAPGHEPPSGGTYNPVSDTRSNGH